MAAKKVAEDRPAIMTVSELSEYLKIHRCTLYRHLAEPDPKKRIPSFRIGSDYRFVTANVDEWIAKQNR